MNSKPEAVSVSDVCTFENKKKVSHPPKENEVKPKKNEKRKKGKKNKGAPRMQDENKEELVIERSPFLDELLAKLADNKEVDYHSLRGHVFECSVDQHGSRYI